MDLAKGASHIPDPEPFAVTRRTVLRSVLWSSFATLLSLPILAATTILLARILGAKGFGRYALYTLLITLLGGLGDLGIGSTILRRGALAAGAGDQTGTLTAVRAGITWTLIQLPWNVGLGFLILPSWTAGGICALASLWTVLFIGPAHYLIMTNQLRMPSLLSLVSGPLSMGAVVGTAVVTHRADLAFGVSLFVGNVLAFALVFAVPKPLRRATFRPGGLGLSRSDLSFGLGNLINLQLNTFVFSKSELLFFSSRGAQARGQFAASQTIAARSTLVPDALLGNLSLGMTSALGKGQDLLHTGFILVSDIVALLFTFIAPLTLVGVAVLSEPLLGHSYKGIAAPAVALAAMSLLQTSASPLISIRFAQKSIRPLIVAGTIGAILDLSAAIVLVPYAGVAGAVIASTAGGVGYLCATVALFRDQIGIRTLAVSHMIRSALIVAYSGVLAVGFLFIPRDMRLVLVLPLTIVWTLAGFRLRPIRVATPLAIDALCESLPRPISRFLRSRSVRLLLAQTT